MCSDRSQLAASRHLALVTVGLSCRAETNGWPRRVQGISGLGSEDPLPYEPPSVENPLVASAFKPNKSYCKPVSSEDATALLPNGGRLLLDVPKGSTHTLGSLHTLCVDTRYSTPVNLNCCQSGRLGVWSVLVREQTAGRVPPRVGDLRLTLIPVWGVEQQWSIAPPQGPVSP